MKDVRDLLKMSGEYIITASLLLNEFPELPVHLLDGYLGDEEFVEGSDCELIYKQPFK